MTCAMAASGNCRCWLIGEALVVEESVGKGCGWAWETWSVDCCSMELACREECGGVGRGWSLAAGRGGAGFRPVCDNNNKEIARSLLTNQHHY